MLNKKSCILALTSLILILIMVSIVCASPFAYITNSGNSTVSVIDTATNNVTATVDNIGTNPFGVAVNPDGIEGICAKRTQ